MKPHTQARKKTRRGEPTAAETRTATRDTMTTGDAGQLRALCEQQIHGLLTALVEATGLDLSKVDVMTVATQSKRTDAPHRIPFAVRIDLTV